MPKKEEPITFSHTNIHASGTIYTTIFTPNNLPDTGYRNKYNNWIPKFKYSDMTLREALNQRIKDYGEILQTNVDNSSVSNKIKDAITTIGLAALPAVVTVTVPIGIGAALLGIGAANVNISPNEGFRQEQFDKENNSIKDLLQKKLPMCSYEENKSYIQNLADWFQREAIQESGITLPYNIKGLANRGEVENIPGQEGKFVKAVDEVFNEHTGKYDPKLAKENWYQVVDKTQLNVETNKEETVRYVEKVEDPSLIQQLNTTLEQKQIPEAEQLKSLNERLEQTFEKTPQQSIDPSLSKNSATLEDILKNMGMEQSTLDKQDGKDSQQNTTSQKDNRTLEDILKNPVSDNTFEKGDNRTLESILKDPNEGLKDKPGEKMQDTQNNSLLKNLYNDLKNNSSSEKPTTSKTSQSVKPGDYNNKQKPFLSTPDSKNLNQASPALRPNPNISR